MTVPPNDDAPYESDIRSNTSSGLGGLFLQLGALINALGSLPAIAAALQQIAADLRRLVGATDSPSWPGLSAYLHQHLARSDTPVFLSLPRIWEDIRNGSATLQQLPATLTDGPLSGTNTPYLASVLAQLEESDGRLNQLVGLENEQSSVLGFVGDEPEGKTIKALLEDNRAENKRAADCCEDGGTDPGDGLNDPPAPENICELTGGPIRATGYVLRQSAGGDDTYAIQFDSAGTDSGGAIAVVAAEAPDAGVDVMRAETDLLFCLAWNLSSGQVPAGGTRTVMGVTPDIGSGSGASIPFAVGENSFGTTPRDTGFHILYELTVPTGTPPPPLNFWLQWGPAPV